MNTTNPKNSSSGMLKKMLPGLLCSAVIIGVLVYFIDWGMLKEALANCSLKLFLLLFAFQALSYFCRGMAWRVILDNRVSPLNAGLTIAEGYLLNLLPLRLGEVGRSVIMGGLIGKSAFYVFTTVILERVFDVLITLIMLVVSLPMLSAANFSGSLYIGLLVVILAGLAFLFWIAGHQETFMNFVRKIIRPESKIGKFVLPKIESLLSGMFILTQPKKFCVWLFWILVTWVCWILNLNIPLHEFFPQLPWYAGFVTQGIGALGGAVPSAPAGIGVLEGAYVVALGLFGIDQSSALAFGLVMHASAIISSIVCGMIGFSTQGLKLGEVFTGLMNQNLEQEKTEDAPHL